MLLEVSNEEIAAGYLLKGTSVAFYFLCGTKKFIASVYK